MLLFEKMKRENIFGNSFLEFESNNAIKFGEKRISILYGPNGTGKTSFAKILNSETGCEYKLNYNSTVYTHAENNLFHIINDQNGRNLIVGETKEFLLGDDIRREYELKDYINNEFDKLFKDTLVSLLKSKFGISKKSSKLIPYINNIIIKDYISDIANKNSKGDNIDRNSFVSYLNELDMEDLGEYDNSKYDYLLKDIEDKKSLISMINQIENDNMVRYEHIQKVEEYNEAIKILKKFPNKTKCVVCDTDINVEELFEKKNSSKDRIYEELNPNTKELLEKNLTLVRESDPFGIKNCLINAIQEGNYALVNTLKDEFEYYFDLFRKNISNVLIVSVKANTHTQINSYLRESP